MSTLRSLLAEFLGSEEKAEQYRQRADAADRWRLRAAGGAPTAYGFDAEQWAERVARDSRPTRRIETSAIPEVDALRAEVIQAFLEFKDR